MNSNRTGIASYDGNRYDWIEIYNSGNSIINIGGYYLSDKTTNPFKWTFPSIIMNPGSFLVVFASRLDTIYPNGEVHTNFSLNKAGEQIILSDPKGNIIDTGAPVSLSIDNSYGRKPDGTGPFNFFSVATPNASNNQTPYKGYCKVPTLSASAGFYTSPFNLLINASDANAEIRYTLDGSEPTLSSPSYTAPIHIKDRSSDTNYLSLIPTSHPASWKTPVLNVEKSTVVRCRVFKAGFLPSPVITATYFVNSGIFSRFKFPVISISTDMENFFDYNTGIYVPGKIYDSVMTVNPGLDPGGATPANFNQSGKEWEKPCHVEYFEKNGVRAFSLDMSVDIHGKSSRSHRQKSLNLKFNSDYNTDKEVNYEIFKGLKKRGNGKPLTTFNSLILRSGGTDWGYSHMRDELIQHLVADTKLDVQAFTPSVVFLNGEYSGLHNIREKYDLFYFKNHYNIDSLSIFSGFNYYSKGDRSSQTQINNLLYYAGLIATHDSAYNFLNKKMDLSDYIDYYVTELYCNNTDWPGNNFKYWRSTNTLPGYGRDGRWRWMLYDTDYGFGYSNGTDYTFNSIEFATATGGPFWPNPDESTWLFRTLMTNRKIRLKFINRYADMLNSNFREQRVLAVIDTFKVRIEPEIPYQINRWNAPSTFNFWLNEIAVLKDFASNRPACNRQDITDYFQLDGVVNVTIDVSDPAHGKVKINTITLDYNLPGAEPSVYPWKGIYFKNVPVPIEAIPAPGYRFVKWEGLINSESQTDTLTTNSDTYLKAIFERESFCEYIPMKSIIFILVSILLLLLFPKRKGKYKNDLKEGKWTLNELNGTLKEKYFYKEGVLTEMKLK